jgi:hypothetical protein
LKKVGPKGIKEPKKEKYFKHLQEINKESSHKFESMINNFHKTMSTMNNNNVDAPAVDDDFLEDSLTHILGTNKTTQRGQMTQTLPNTKTVKNNIEESFGSTGFEIMIPLT